MNANIKEQTPILSIYVATYNHEKYIKKALDSIFMQKTEYTYEVLVGEDCSTDGTREVLKNYERTHPCYIQDGILKIFYRDHNMNQEEISNSCDLRNRANGKYLIALEGDDYWTDENKIDMQIRFLEKHPDYIAIAHNCMVVDEDGKCINENYPECKDTEYGFDKFMHNILPGQLTTVMYRNIYNDTSINLSLMKKDLMPSDRLLYLTLLLHGRIYCIQKKMSAYRHITTHGESFSATHKYIFSESEKYYREILLYLCNFTVKEEKYAEILYVRCIMKGIRCKQCSLKQANKYFSNLKHKYYALGMWIRYKWRKDILHKSEWL